ncbi:MAG: PaaI family thioesterase [Bacteroidia bacterium]|nr:PaaI family thioesterase [Bacteroidia bacterium]
MIDHKNIKIDQLQAMLSNTLSDNLGMEVVELGPDFLIMRMPVDHRTKQPFGILDGGASMALVESAASFAGNIWVQSENKRCVGLEINGNHIRSVKSGWVYGKATPIHTGKRTHVWNVDITNDQEQLVCKARMTLAVIDPS